MAITFSVAQNKFADNLTAADLATAVKAWLDGLSITTVYSITTVHLQGFWVVLAVYV